MTGGGRVDLRSGELWPQPAIEYVPEVGEEDEDDGDAPWWLPVECEGSRAGYRDMCEFITTVPDEDRRDRLEIALQGPRRVPPVQRRPGPWPGELERWYGFSEERQRGRARAWLADAGYGAEPPAERAAR